MLSYVFYLMKNLLSFFNILNDFFNEDADSDEIGAAVSKLSQIQKMHLIDFLKSL